MSKTKAYLCAITLTLTSIVLVCVNHWERWFPPDPIREPAQKIIDMLYYDDAAPWKRLGSCHIAQTGSSLVYKFEIQTYGGIDAYPNICIKSNVDVSDEFDFNRTERMAIRDAVKYRCQWCETEDKNKAFKMIGVTP